MYSRVKRETVDYVLDEMEEVLNEDQLEAKQVCTYLRATAKPVTRIPHQRMVAADKLLERTEVNFWTCCDLLRYRQLKKLRRGQIFADGLSQ